MRFRRGSSAHKLPKARVLTGLRINPIRMDSAGSVHELLARLERAKATQGPEPMPGKLVPPSVCGPILILW